MAILVGKGNICGVVKTMIWNLRNWVSCEHRRGGYFLTQALASHGFFMVYLRYVGRDHTER